MMASGFLTGIPTGTHSKITGIPKGTANCIGKKQVEFFTNQVLFMRLLIVDSNVGRLRETLFDSYEEKISFVFLGFGNYSMQKRLFLIST